MDYGVYLSTKFKPKKKGSGIRVVEPDDYKDSEIKAIKKCGYILLAYLSIGTLEKERSWFEKYKKYRKQRLGDWPNEWYMDMTSTDWRQFLVNRAKTLKKRGFDGFWLDNLDVYEYNRSTKVFAACKAVLKQIKAVGGYIMVNGGSEFFDKAMDKKLKLKAMVDGVTQEEVYSRITNYSGKGKFGEQKADQHKWYKEYMKRLKKHGAQTFLLEYTRDDKLKTRIKNFCKKYGMTGYYISEDVDL